MIGGYSSCNLGHSHPSIVEAAIDQLHTLDFALGGQHPWRDRAQSALASLWRPSHSETIQVWLSNGGARAIEVAWKLAHTVRPGDIARFDLAYHGRSLATACISDTQRSKVSEGWLTAQLQLPFPIGCQCDVETHDGAALCAACTHALEIADARIDAYADAISFVILEPAIGSRGYYFAPATFYRRLTDLARAKGWLVVSDEIQMGLGRLGPAIVSQHDGWSPDLVVLGKSLGGGIVPISAVLGRQSIMSRLDEGIESETFAASPLGCRVACAVLEALTTPGLLYDADRMGRAFRDRLRSRLAANVTVRGRGLATALGCEAWGQASAKRTGLWVEALAGRGLLAHLTGPNRDRIALLPPLNISESLLDEAVAMLAETCPAPE
jgi:4-aminobutyrate aminotransferase-like enzyme